MDVHKATEQAYKNGYAAARHPLIREWIDHNENGWHSYECPTCHHTHAFATWCCPQCGEPLYPPTARVHE